MRPHNRQAHFGSKTGLFLEAMSKSELSLGTPFSNESGRGILSPVSLGLEDSRDKNEGPVLSP